MLDRPRVKGGKSTKRMLTDIVSLIRYIIERDHNEQAMLEPYSEVVAQRFAIWLKDRASTRSTLHRRATAMADHDPRHHRLIGYHRDRRL